MTLESAIPRGVGAPALVAASGLSLGVLVSFVSSLPLVALALLTLLAVTGLFVFSRPAGPSAPSVAAAPAAFFSPVLLFVLFAAIGAAETRLLRIERATRAFHDLRALPPDALVEVTGRITSPWRKSGSVHVANLAPLAVRRAADPERRPLAAPVRLRLQVGGGRDPLAVLRPGDLVRARGEVRWPEVAPDDPFRLVRQAPRLSLKSVALAERLEAAPGPLRLVQSLHGWTLERIRAAGKALDEVLLAVTGAPVVASSLAAPLLEALLLGETADMPPGIDGLFRRGGVAHVLAVSGLQVALVAACLAWGLAALGLAPRTCDLLLLLLVPAFAVMAGGEAPVVRASIMIGVVLVGRLAGRPTPPANAVGVAGLIILAVEPWSLFDAGFLLTFVAVLGLIALTWRTSRLLGRRFPGLPASIRDGLAATLAAEAAIVPLQAALFGQVPLVALATNLVVVPLSGLFLTGSLLALPILAIPGFPFLTALALAPLELLARLLVLLLDGMDRLAGPGAVLLVATPPVWLVACAWIGLISLGAASTRAGRRTGGLVAGAATVVILVSHSEGPSGGRAESVALDVGQGDATLLRTGRGAVVVDAGGSPDQRYDFGRLHVVPRLGERGIARLDALVVTHVHPDHARGAIGVLEALRVRKVVLPCGAGPAPDLVALGAAAARRGVPIHRACAGDVIEAGGLTLAVKHPGPYRYPRSRENNGSLVLLAVAGGARLLLTGDIEALAEADLVAREGDGLRAEVLKVAHHGSRTSTTEAFLAAARPRLAIVSCGRANRFGHPSAGVVDRLRRAGVSVLRTDRSGEISMSLERGRIVVEREIWWPVRLPGDPGGIR